MNDIILKAENICYAYEDGNQALKGINLEIRKGRKIAFMGANGSGKSTFFLCLNGIHRPGSGTMYFYGKPYDYSRKGLLALRSKVGIVFQDPDNQLFSASVYQEISFGILNLGVDEQTAKKEVEEVIEHLEITPFRSKPTHALSGGQKKQVSIADILVMHPDVIIFDEPAAALDPKHTTLVNQIIDQLTDQGITVIISTHDVDFALKWADDVVLFKDGTVYMEGAPEEVFVNKSVLHQTNLEQPAAIQLFESLCKKGVLLPSLPLPKSLSTLEGYIEKISIKPHYGGTKLEDTNKKQAILVVSFGTSYDETRKVTIDAIENSIQEAFPEFRIYRAWTSKMILAKIKKRDGIHINNVKEAMEQMKADGITDVVVQPTHVINGIENDLMQEDALSYQESFHSIRFGNPLLTTEEDNQTVIQAVSSEFSSLSEDEVLVMMGHGTTHYANAIYAALDYAFKDYGHENIYLGTVEAYPSMSSILKMIAAKKPKKVVLAPFMIVAGDHARNDMAGDDPESWYCQLKEAGYHVECVLKGLGEYSSIRNLFINHIQMTLNEK